MKNLRSPLLLLSLFVTTALYADWQQTLRTSFEALDGLIVPPEARPKFLQTGPDPEHDYTGEVAALLKGNPDAPFLCAALNEIASPIRMLPQSAPLRAKELEMCKAYPFTPQQFDEVRKWLHPPPPPRREQIVMELQGREQSNRWFSGMGIYAPPPLDPMDWVNGNTQGRDYRKDVEMDFDANPLRAATVCVSATRAHATTADARILLPILLDVCKAFPDSKIETAFAAQKTHEAKAWLTGLMNTLLDEAAQLSSDLRRREASSVITSLATAQASSARFQSTLRVIAFTPEDWRGPAAALRCANEASYSSPHAQPSEVKSWLEELYAHKISFESDPWPWKRGARAYYVLVGRLDRANTLAREIANHRDSNQHSLDIIYLAAIERASGNRKPYDRLFAQCPEPDPQYLQEHGQQSRTVKYCEDVVSEFAKGVRDELRTGPAAAEFAQMTAETNRVSPAATVASAPPPPKIELSKGTQFEDWFAAIVNQTLDLAATKSTVEREQASAALAEFADSDRSIGLERAIQLVVFRPWHEAAAARLIREIHSLGYSSDYDQRKIAEQLVARLYERQAATAANADEWKRGLRAFLLFNGDYARALALSREIARNPNPRFAARDALLLGIAERISGNAEPYRKVIQNCPPQPPESARRDGPLKDPTEFCRGGAFWEASRAVSIWKRKTPATYVEILKETVHDQGLSTLMRVSAATLLGRVDDQTAALQWLELLKTRDFPPDGRMAAYYELARISERQKDWLAGIIWTDRYLYATEFTDPGMPPEGWKRLDQLSDLSIGWSDAQFEMLEVRLRLSIGARDIENAQRSIEYMLGTSARDARLRVIQALIDLASFEVDSGRRNEALRIAGFVANQALGGFLSAKLLQLRTKLGTIDGKPVDPQRQDTPWNSPPRLPRRIQAPPLETKVS